MTVSYDVSLVEAHRAQLRAPVEWTSPLAAHWGFGNGVGAHGFHLHNIFPDRRYAYDIGFDDPGAPKTWRIDQSQPDENWNFLCWSRTVVAMADGVVVTADGTQLDHDPGNTSGAANVVVLRHDLQGFPNHVYTVYVHMRHNGVTVRPGDTVRAGDPLGLIGDTGWSTAPHLDVSAFTYDDAGRLRALPLSLLDLSPAAASDANVPADTARFPLVPGT